MTELFIQGILKIRFLDVIDILLVAFLLYELYNLVKGTVAINIFVGIVAIYFLWKLVSYFEMELLSKLLGQFISVGVIALMIVFQEEIRQFLLLLGTTKFFKRDSRSFLTRWNVNNFGKEDLVAMVEACNSMSKTKTGALIVIARLNELKQYIETGDLIEARISEQLLKNIFFKNSPLHDGAVIIVDNMIKAARCVLPVSDKSEFPADLGLRHRAAVGVTEKSDAIALVVSEQTGQISYCKGGVLRTNVTPEKLLKFLESYIVAV
ncbi:MAG: diadenylate cyclase CdaA [Bacteroidota bacterium]|nr:diadenylate cyclase CdaA [Bacteroidota bacterium]